MGQNAYRVMASGNIKAQTSQHWKNPKQILMDPSLWLYIFFDSISVISGWWKSEIEGICAMTHRLGSDRNSALVGFKPKTPWSEVWSANCSAKQTLLKQTFDFYHTLFIKHCGKTFEPRHKKTCLRGLDQTRLKLACSALEDSQSLQMFNTASTDTIHEANNKGAD